jgi:hypothetical protein
MGDSGLMRAWLVVLVTLMVASCARPRPPVDLGGAWPTDPRPYGETARAWTRHASLWDGYDRILEVHATFKAPEWRAAFVARRAAVGGLPDAARAALLEQQRQDAAEHYEVQLLVSTQDRRENDLHRGARSVWRLSLVDDRGNELEPVSVRRDRRPRGIIEAEYPDMDDFFTAYVVRFPRTAELLRPDAQRFSLKMASARGGVELVWEAPAR